MHDNTPESLRKQALKSNGKTLSRKAQAKLTSLTPSAAGSSPNSKNVSRASSAVVSRAGSDAGWPGSRPDSRMGSSDEEIPSLNQSLSQMLQADDIPDAGDDDDEAAWADTFAEELRELLDNNFWKRSTPQTREQALAGYARALLARHAPEQVEPFAARMVALLKKVVKAEDTVNSSVLALKGLALTVVTLPSDDLYRDTVATVRETIVDSSSIPIKTEALHTYALLSFFADLDADALATNMAFLLGIVSSDGGQIDAADVAEPVVAALEAWALLATAADDLALDAEGAVEAFLEQLSSASAPVIIAAGHAIALLYEKEHAAAPADDTEDAAAAAGQFQLYSRQDLLEARLAALAKESSRAFSSAERKALHGAGADVLAGVREPGRGPRYSDVQDADTGAELGHRLKLRVAPTSFAVVSSWEQLVRLNALRRLLRDGFRTQWEENAAVRGALPLEMVGVSEWKKGEKGKAGKKGGRKGGRRGFD